MPSSIERLDPKAVWSFFADIAAVPRPSKQEERIRAHIRDVAGKNGLKAREDSVGNVLIEVPARGARAGAPTIVLQAHLDMVTEKNAGTTHDFDKDGIRCVIDKDAAGAPIVRADGTTLGADNGIGVAMALAAATDKDVTHGPLELLLTIDEEAGMTGANALAPEFFRGRTLLNLDSEEDGAIYIGCAGGCDVTLKWNLPASALLAGVEICRVSVNGLRGGHSGGDIHEGRANALKLVVRTLARAHCDDLQIIELAGGSKRNAIPREGHAVVAGKKGLREALAAAAADIERDAKAESHEDGITIRVEPVSGAPQPGADAAVSRRLVAALLAVPSGVLGMHPKVAGLVETSNNLSTATTSKVGKNTIIEVGMLARSSSTSRLDEAAAMLLSVGTLAGADAQTGNRYEGWDPNVDSPVLKRAVQVFEKRFDHPPKVAAIHAGLECGIIGRRVGGMDMISFGPRIEGAHSPDERVWVDSVARSWEFLKALLADLAR